MSRFLGVFIAALAAIAAAKSFGKYRNIVLTAGPGAAVFAPRPENGKLRDFIEKYGKLKLKTARLDRSVETNEKLRYLVHSDNFEEALFLIDYLGERFMRDLPSKSAAELDDLRFYLKRLDQNLAVVESALKRIDDRALVAGGR